MDVRGASTAVARRFGPVDAAFAILLVACATYAVRAWAHEPAPAMPDGICLVDRPLPRPHGIAILIGAIEPGDPERDPAQAHVEYVERALAERGFVRAGSRFARGDVVVDLVGPADLPFEDTTTTSAAIARARAEREIVFYNGHSYDGALALPAGAGTLVLDTCWSAQLYAHAADGPGVVVANSERAVTGSVETAIALIDGATLSDINELARDRAAQRASRRFPDPERYGVLARCR